MATSRVKVKFIRSNEVEVADCAVGSDAEMEDNPFQSSRGRRRYEIYSPLRSFPSTSTLNRIDEVSESEIDSEDDSSYDTNTNASVSTVITNASLARSINRSLIHAIERELARMKRIQRSKATLAAKKAAMKGKEEGEEEQSKWKQQYENPAEQYRSPRGPANLSKHMQMSRSSTMTDVRRNESRGSSRHAGIVSSKQLQNSHPTQSMPTRGRLGRRNNNTINNHHNKMTGVSSNQSKVKQGQQTSSNQISGQRKQPNKRLTVNGVDGHRKTNGASRITAASSLRVSRENTTHLQRSRSFVNNRQQQCEPASRMEKQHVTERSDEVQMTQNLSNAQSTPSRSPSQYRQSQPKVITSLQRQSTFPSSRIVGNSTGRDSGDDESYARYERANRKMETSLRPDYSRQSTQHGKRYYIHGVTSVGASKSDNVSLNLNDSFDVRVSYLTDLDQKEQARYQNSDCVLGGDNIREHGNITGASSPVLDHNTNELRIKDTAKPGGHVPLSKIQNDGKTNSRDKNLREADESFQLPLNTNTDKEPTTIEALTATTESDNTEVDKPQHRRSKDCRPYRPHKLTGDDLTDDSFNVNEKIEKYFSSMESLKQAAESGQNTERTDKLDVSAYDTIPEENISSPTKSANKDSHSRKSKNTSDATKFNSGEYKNQQTKIRERESKQLPKQVREKTDIQHSMRKSDRDYHALGSSNKTTNKKLPSDSEVLHHESQDIKQQATDSIAHTSAVTGQGKSQTRSKMSTNKIVITSQNPTNGSSKKTQGGDVIKYDRKNGEKGYGRQKTKIQQQHTSEEHNSEEAVLEKGTVVLHNSKNPGLKTTMISTPPNMVQQQHVKKDIQRTDKSKNGKSNANFEKDTAMNRLPDCSFGNMMLPLNDQPTGRQDIDPFEEGHHLQERMASFVERTKVKTPQNPWEGDILSFMDEMITPGRLGKTVLIDDQHIKLEVAQILSDMTGFIAHQEDVLNNDATRDSDDESNPDVQPDAAQGYDSLQSPKDYEKYMTDNAQGYDSLRSSKDYDRYMSLPQSRIGGIEDASPMHNTGDKSYRSEIVAGDFSSSHKVNSKEPEKGGLLPRITLRNTTKIMSSFPNILKEYGLQSAKKERQPPIEVKKKKPRTKAYTGSPVGGQRRKDNYLVKIQSIVNEQMIKYDNYVKHMTDKVDKQREGLKRYFEEREKKFADDEEMRRRSQRKRTTHEYIDDASFMKAFPQTSYYKVTDMFDKMRKDGRLKNQPEYDNFWESFAKPQINKKKPYHSQGLYPMSDDNIISKVRDASRNKDLSKILLPAIPKPKPIIITDDHKHDSENRNKLARDNTHVSFKEVV